MGGGLRCILLIKAINRVFVVVVEDGDVRRVDLFCHICVGFAVCIYCEGQLLVPSTFV